MACASQKCEGCFGLWFTKEEAGFESEVDSGNESDDTDGRDRVEQEDEFQFDVLTREEIAQHMVDCIKDVNTIVEIPPTITRILLNHLKWDSEKLYERYFGDKERLFREAHIVNSQQETNASSSKPAEIPPTIMKIFLSHRKWVLAKLCECYFDGDKESLSREAHIVNSQQETSASSSKPAEISPSNRSWLKVCEICLRDMPRFMMTGLICGDRFCSECWTVYLTTKIMDEGDVQRLTCAAQTCDTIVEDQIVMNLIKDRRVKSKYQHLIINNFVACSLLFQWCPQPGCNNAIKASNFAARPVTCKCGRTFCFSCARNWHDPIKCSLLEKWEKKYEDREQEESYNASKCDDDDSETSNWNAANIKECPKCKVTIEKDGGCNHMTCGNRSCKFDFCWVCLRPWNSDECTGYDCNRYDDDEVEKAARDAQVISQAALEGYQFYCNRYMNHMDSLKFEKKNELYASAKAKMDEMQQLNMSWTDVQFLKKAVDVLCQCRHTLMYTYVFAYYLKKDNESVIFEGNQHDLEHYTEQLSELLERHITKENLLSIKQKVLDKCGYCEKRRKVLLEHVHQGYNEHFWEYNEEL